jgi:hypothetical protein
VSPSPLVSVIVPAWNAAGTLERAARSILDDATVEVECLIVDDGSTDGTAALADRLAAADGRIVVVRSPGNEGVSAARNRALPLVRGAWVTFLDADDRLLPGGLAALVRGTRQAGVRAVIGQRVWTDGRRRWRSVAYDIPDIRRPGRKALVTHPGLLRYASATGKLVDRSLIEGLRFEGRVLGDQPWTVRALLRAGDGILVLRDDVYEWSRPRRGAASSSITAAKLGSARLAAEAARVAIGALAEVAAEAEASVADPVARARLVDAYFRRLVESDLAGPVARAASRNDPAGDELFEAVGAFLASAPAGLVEGSNAVARAIVLPPLERWRGFGEPGRGAYVAMVRRLLGEHPGTIDRVAGGPLLRQALAVLAGGGPGSVARFERLVRLNWPFAIGHRAATRARFGARALRARLL